MRILTTGATGFVGRALCSRLPQRGHACIPAVRASSGLLHEAVVGEIDANTDWRAALSACSSPGRHGEAVDAIVHLAARVHVMHDRAADPLALYREVNTAGTLNLARQAAEAGVKRFVFVSSIKVNGEGRDTAYVETDQPAPEDPYAISKWEAELGLRQIESETGMAVVVLRPPLVYGPGVKANFRRLIDIVSRGRPLPLGAIHNRRSLLYLGNFVDAIQVCLEHPAAAGQTFLIDDGQPVSTPELIRAVANALHRPARLLPVPSAVLETAAALLGKRAAVKRLTGSLWVDSSLIRTRLGWVPPYSMAEGLAATVAS